MLVFVATSGCERAPQSAPASGDVASLSGTWVSDRQRSMDFNRANAKLKPETIEFLDQLLGRQTLAFDDRTMRAVMPAFQVSVKGKQYAMAAMDEPQPYEVLHAGAHVVVVRSESRFIGTQVTTFNFIDANTFWIYTGGPAGSETPDLHTREYFTRIRVERSPQRP